MDIRMYPKACFAVEDCDMLQVERVVRGGDWCRKCPNEPVCDRDICSRGVKLTSNKPPKFKSC